MLTSKDAKELLGLTDRELARVANRYDYEPIMALVTHRGIQELPAPDVFKGFLDVWSDPKSTNKFLKEQLGVDFIKDIYEGYSDGGCAPVYGSPWGAFTCQGNYYDFECFIPVLRWALLHKAQEVGD